MGMDKPRRTLPEMLPYSAAWPADPRKRGWATAARIGGYVIIFGAILTSIIQFQYLTVRNLRDAARFDSQHPHLTDRQAAELGLDRPKDHAGAIARWRTAVRQFWAGGNIYRGQDPDAEQDVWLHPNMPFTVILLTPFAYLPPPAMAAVLSAAKALVLLAAFWAAVRLANHGGLRVPDWVVFLALAYAVMPIVGDIRHGNTNVFVLGAIVLHLWLYRRGRDIAAGTGLALAVCLKMTPALFVLYWLYQRNWKLLGAAAVALAVFTVVIPLGACIGIQGFHAKAGVDHFATLNSTWLDNLILPGLVKASWYPIHINQSLPAVTGRYLLGPDSGNSAGNGGNVFWNPDDVLYSLRDANKDQWINVASLPESQVKWIIRLLQFAVVGLMAWAIGWRKLPRDDGRRALHYGMVVLGILILNQRTWDHHGAILPIASLAVWYALCHGRFGRGLRWTCLLLVILAGPMIVLPGVAGAMDRLLGGTSRAAKHVADVVDAYGPRLLHYLLMLVAAALLSAALRKSEDPYAEQRQTLKAEA